MRVRGAKKTRHHRLIACPETCQDPTETGPETWPTGAIDMTIKLTQATVSRLSEDHPAGAQIYDSEAKGLRLVVGKRGIASMSRPVEAQEVVEDARKAFMSFATAVEASNKEYGEKLIQQDNDLTSVRATSDEISQSLKELRGSVNEKLTEWQDDFVTKQTERAETYSAAHIEREENFSKAQMDQQSIFDAELKKLTETQLTRFEKAYATFQSSSTTAEEEIKKHQAAIRKLHGLVTDETVAGGYHKGATDEKKQADTWRNRSLACLTVAAVWLVVKYFMGFATTPSDEVNWPDILTVASITAILLYAAGYTSRQSAMHRSNEKAMRSYALETQALDPFIASLKTTEQQAIKAELVRRMFGQQNSQSQGKRRDDNDENVKTLLDKLPAALADAVGKVVNKS